MKHIYVALLLALTLICSRTMAQNGLRSSSSIDSTSALSNSATIIPSSLHNPSLALMDGSTFLGPTYSLSACGLNYTTVSVKIGQRFTPAGVPQPATFAISGIPTTATIQKAFVWCDASGNGNPITITVVNPFTASLTFPMTLIGSDADKCWGYSGTHSYRADITALVWGNGNYDISGFPTNSTNDVDGATLMVIWSDATAGFQGDITLWDGAVMIAGASTTQTINNFQASCQYGTINAKAFMCVADLQGLNSQLTLNGTFPVTCVEDWWNYVEIPTTLTVNQNSSVFGCNSTNGGDCFNFCMMGLYYQSYCTTCCLNPFTLNTSSSSSLCSAGNGSASTTAIGGSGGPYTYSWNTSPVQTTSTASNLPPGQYIVTVADTGGCSDMDTVIVAGTGSLPLTGTQVNVGCNGASTGTAIITPGGGPGPYVYSWSTPLGGNDSTASGLNAGIYTVAVNDSFGCNNSYTFAITEPPLVPLVASLTGKPAICIGDTIFLTASASGGNGGPYSYTWLNAIGNSTTAFAVPLATTTYSVVINDTCFTPADTAIWTIVVNPLPTIQVSASPTQGCPQLCPTFTSTSTPPSVSCTWNFGDNTSALGCQTSHCYDSTGSYTIEIIVTDTNGCVDSLLLPGYITVHPVPIADIAILSIQPAVLDQASILFDDLSSGGDTCYWNFGDGDSLTVSNCTDISYTYDAIGIYDVKHIVVNQFGCRDTSSAQVEIIPQTIVYIPNTFTPNADGINDQFTAIGQYIEDYKMMIYDRWGNLLYTSNSLNQGWDGRIAGSSEMAPIDTYVYVITCSTVYFPEKLKYIGHVNLIR